MPNEKSPEKNGLRVLVLVSATCLLWWLSFWIAAPSERFNALLVPLGLLAFFLSPNRSNKLLAVAVAGTAIGAIGFYTLGSTQAAQLGAYLSWWEVVQKLYFTAGLLVLYSGLAAIISIPLKLLPATRTLLLAPKGWWLRLLCLGVALIAFAPYVYVTFNVHRFKYVSSSNPQSRDGLPYRAVNFTARDGARLKGWFIPNKGGQHTIVVVHGIGSNRGDMLGVVPFLHRAGFNVFLFDLRSHGESSGHTITFGVTESRDVEAATRWVSQQRGGKKIGVLAYSMGGSSVLHAIGDDGLPQVGAIVLDSTFAEFAPLARRQLTFLPDKAVGPFLSLLSFYTRLEIGVGLEDIEPRRYIERISPRPLLLIHGTGDSLVPSSQAQINYASARSPKQLHWIEGAEHCAGHQVEGAAYEERIINFFNRALK